MMRHHAAPHTAHLPAATAKYQPISTQEADDHTQPRDAQPADPEPHMPISSKLSALSPCPLYDVASTWEDNLKAGPHYKPAHILSVAAPPDDKWIDFLGAKLASPLGVPAGPLLSSEWIVLAGSMGYDCLTYKTIRSHSHTGHGLPNILYVDTPGQLEVTGPSSHEPLRASLAPKPGAGIAITNSFGMPSQAPQQLKADIPKATAALRPGQQLVVSITGTSGRPGITFSQDLAQTAHIATGAGARALEVNLSCPNVGSSHVLLYQDAAMVEALVRALVQEVGKHPVLLKLGAYTDQDQMRRVMQAAAAAGARGVSGINGLSRQVEDADGSPALGACRPSSGICGDPIRKAGLDFVTQARQVIAAEALHLELVGMGGVTRAEHVMDYLRAGADVVQSATGFMWNPDLGFDFQRLWAQAGYQRPLADGRGGSY